MSDAADDMIDWAMQREIEWDLFMDAIRSKCAHRVLGRIPCVMIETPTPDDYTEDYLPLTCMHCGKQFDREY